MLQAGLVPDVYVGMGNTAAAWGCFEPHTPGVSKGKVAGMLARLKQVLVACASKHETHEDS